MGYSAHCPQGTSFCALLQFLLQLNEGQTAARLPREAEPHGDQEFSELLTLGRGRGIKRIQVEGGWLPFVFAKRALNQIV